MVAEQVAQSDRIGMVMMRAIGRGRARDAVKHLLILGQVWESPVQPRLHDVAAQPCAADVNPSRRRIYLLHARVGRQRLVLRTIAPGGETGAGGLVGVVRIDPRVFAGVGGEPRIQVRVRRANRADRQGENDNQQLRPNLPGSDVRCLHAHRIGGPMLRNYEGREIVSRREKTALMGLSTGPYSL